MRESFLPCHDHFNTYNQSFIAGVKGGMLDNNSKTERPK